MSVDTFNGNNKIRICPIACGQFQACDPPQLRVLRGPKHGTVKEEDVGCLEMVTTDEDRVPRGGWAEIKSQR